MLLTWTTGPGHFIKVGLLAALLLLGISIPKAHADRHPAGCTGSGLGISLFTSLPDVHIGDTIYYSVLVLNSPFPACDAGELDPASAGAITAFVVTPDGVTNAITLRRTFLAPGESDYYTNIVSYVVRAQDVRSDGTVRATAVDQGDIHQNDVNSRGGGNQGVNTQVNLPCVLITAQCVGSVGENGLITFTGTVTNCGNNTLVGVTVTNINERGTFAVLFPTNLAFGQVSSFHGSWLPLNPCLPSTALLTVLATDQFTATPRTLTNFITITCQNSLTPGIKVTKLCPSQPVPPGQLLTFSGSVTNTGNVTLTNIVVVDDRPVANTPVFALASLAPGASANFTGSYTAPTNCAATDTLTATASSVCGAAVVSSASATCPILTTPRLTVSANCSGSPVAPGGLLAYSGTVTNTGDITLTNVVVVSDQPVANTRLLTLATLAPGAGANFSGSYTVSANACSATTTVGASGQDLCNGLVAASTLPITCPITTAPAIAVTLVCPAAPVPAGGLITYTGAVRNSGNVTLNNVTVVDNQAQPSTVLSVASLAPGASANFTASFTARADACSVSSTVTATGKDNCSSAPVSNTASATCPLVTTPSIAVTQACPGTPANPGGPLAYTGTVRNSGNVTLTNVMVWNNLSGASPIFTSPILAPGQAANFSGSYVAPTNCLSTSVSTATGQSICGVSVTNSVTTSCPILTAAQISVTAVCPTTPTAPGTLLTYTGTILNRGNITVTNIVVVSDRPALNTTVFTTASLAPGASAAFTGSYTVPVDVCPVAATLKVTGKDLCSGSTVADTFVSTCSVSAAPGIAVTLACPADTSGAGINVALNGNATQSSTFVGNGFTNSASLAVDGNTDGSAFSASVAITGFEKNGWWQVDLGSIRNLRTVNVWGRSDTAFEQSSNLYLFVSDTPFLSGGLAATLAQSGVTSFYTPGYVGAPGVYSVNRTGRYLRVQLAGTGFLALTEVQAYEPAVQTNGVTLTYTGTVRNSGNVTLKNVTVVNNHPAPNTVVFTTPSLAPGVSANFTESFATPTDTCSASSTVTATGTDDCTRVPVSNSAAATCSLSTQPGIAMTLTCPPGPASPGSPLTYGGTVHNTGNVTLTNVVVLNNLSGSAPVFTSASLAPGQTANFTGSYLAPTNCSSTSIAIVTGKSICGVSVTNSATATCDVQLAPEIEVTQDCPATPVLPGGVLTYRGTVSNVGNITLTNVIVFNNRPASNTVIFTVARLAPGASANFTGSYQVPLNCCSSSSTVDATGQDICSGLTVADTYTATCTALTVPQIVVTKVCPSTLLQPGDMLHYSGTVSNAGNVTLVNVTVVNTQPNAGAPVLGPIALAPGESVTYYGAYIVPPDFCGLDTVTARGLDVCTSVAVVNSATTTCPILTAPRISVMMNCPVQPTPKGGLFIYTGSVSNSGNVTLVNVVVDNNYQTDCYSRTNGRVIGPITLAPGASVPFSGRYTAPLSCCELIDTLTARGQDRCAGSNVMATSTAVCPLLSKPSLALVQDCPPNPIPMGSTYNFFGYVTNTGDATLTNVLVFGPQGTNSPVVGPIDLAPGEAEPYSGSYVVPFDTCSVTVAASSQDICGGLLVTNSASCPVATSPGLSITEDCPSGPVSAGSSVTYGGSVKNTGNITLGNILVFSSQPGGSSPVLGPISLAPGASAPYTGTYLASGGSHPTTNTIVATTTNITSVTNIVASGGASSFGTINTLSQVVTDRFPVGTNFDGLAYASEDHGYGATEFYSSRKAASGTSFFDTITASTTTVADRFNAGNRTFNALAYAAPDVGYGPLLFYYISRDSAGLSTFGSITPGGTTGVVTDHFVLGNNFDALTFAATDVGYGANLFYYVRHDASGLSTFGTINPALPGTITDRFTIGNNVDALCFTALAAPGFGADNFYYLRHDARGLSTFGTIFVTGLATATVTDRFTVGTNATELEFTATDVGFGANLFYFLRAGGLGATTNIVSTTNTVVTTTQVISFTPTNTVTAIGADICQNRNVSAAADCLGPVGGVQLEPAVSAPSVVNGVFGLSLSSQSGTTYTVQYKNNLSDPSWTNLEDIVGTGGELRITNAVNILQPTRFYRVILKP